MFWVGPGRCWIGPSPERSVEACKNSVVGQNTETGASGLGTEQTALSGIGCRAALGERLDSPEDHGLTRRRNSRASNAHAYGSGKLALSPVRTRRRIDPPLPVLWIPVISLCGTVPVPWGLVGIGRNTMSLGASVRRRVLRSPGRRRGFCSCSPYGPSHASFPVGRKGHALAPPMPICPGEHRAIGGVCRAEVVPAILDVPIVMAAAMDVSRDRVRLPTIANPESDLPLAYRFYRPVGEPALRLCRPKALNEAPQSRLSPSLVHRVARYRTFAGWVGPRPTDQLLSCGPL